MLNKMSDNFEWFVSPFASSNDIGHGTKLFRKILLRFSCLLLLQTTFLRNESDSESDVACLCKRRTLMVG